MSSELLGSAENALKGNLGGAWDILSGYADAYTDLGIGKKFGGAAAAYSLRDVGAMNGPVVRVRRDSDNAEQDFSALAVPYIPEWCNRQVIKPLDVRELNSGGSGNRDGNFVIAKAAYSLRSLGDRQAIIPNDESSPLNEDTNVPASGKYVVQVRRNVDGTIKSFTADEVTDGTLVSFVNESFTSSLPLDVQGSAAAAYSLRDLSSTYSGAVVNVRRSLDDTTRDFTADSITNGDLLTFVNEIQALGTVTNSVGNNGFTLTNASNTGFTATLSSGVGVCGWGYTAVSGDKITVSFDAVVRSGSPQFLPRKATALSSDNLNNVTSDLPLAIPSTGSYSFEFTYDENDAGSLTFSEGDTPSDFDISNFQITAYKGAGHVATWYDQSGNSKHATQGTAGSQPKVVSAGSLIVDGQSKPAIKFTTSDSSSLLVDNFSATQAYSYIFKANAEKASDQQQIIDGDTGTPAFIQIGTDGVLTASNGNAVATSADLDSLSSDFIFTAIINGASSNAFFNSSNVMSSQDVGSNNLVGLTLGKHRNQDRFYYDNQLSELIVIDSDQTEKRRAIEESVSGHYGITLGSFSRDGMVRTWYDQSVSDQGSTATGNHAVQATAANQPKVVSNGSLVADQGIDFDDASEHSLVASSVSGMEEKLSVFSTSVRDSTGYTVSLSSSSSGSKYFAILENASDSTLSSRNESTVQAAPSVSGNTRLTFGLTTGDTVTSAGALGGALTTNTADYGDDFGSGDLDQILIGALRTVSPSAGHYFEGRIREILVYASSATGDQTDNRGAFEANIAEHYNISGVAAEDNQVNGFVETWYDQSGNAKNAVQATATYQPKIVHEGSFNTDGGLLFDGDDTFLDSGSSTSLGTEFFVTGVMNLNTAGDNNAAIITNAEAGGGDRLFVGSSNDILRIRDDSTNIDSSLVLSKTADNLFAYQASASSFTFVKNGTTNAKSALSGGQSYRYMGGGSGGFNLSANMKELIIYSSDKTSDRTAIESNINNHYLIF